MNDNYNSIWNPPVIISSSACTYKDDIRLEEFERIKKLKRRKKKMNKIYNNINKNEI